DARLRQLCSTYSAQDHRIRDGVQTSGYPVCTFAGILKYESLPLAEILTEILALGRQGMGCPVEIEFAVNMPSDADQQSLFELLQIRPMAVNRSNLNVEISKDDITRAICYSTMALGNGRFEEIQDIIFVNPETFNAADTIKIAGEINQVNKEMVRRNERYLLIGPGRWGSADRWLGIPVRWTDISGVGAIVETTIEGLKADPSQGSHFFQNITSLGISYLNTSKGGEDFIDWKWLQSLPAVTEPPHLKHVRVEKPLLIKIDGKESKGVIIP
ncbi:MAG: phosphoenolpyruvate synthase PpsA, partial [Desulfobacterales bacterium]